MPTWIEVPEKHGGGTNRGRPRAKETVRYRGPEGTRRNGELHLSADLVPEGAERGTILSDGNGRLAVRLGPEGTHKLVRKSGGAVKFAVRKTATQFIPSDFSGPVEWTREDDLIVIDTRQFHKPV